jgi:hypothetical protein
MLLALMTWLAQASVPAVVVLRCELRDDPQVRIYELQRSDDGNDAAWSLVMRSREAGRSPVRLPLPGAAPAIAGDRVTLDYQTQNGGRDIQWQVAPDAASLDVHANFELEVNVEPDLDPRVELMNTGGAVSNLVCTVTPPRGIR